MTDSNDHSDHMWEDFAQPNKSDKDMWDGHVWDRVYARTYNWKCSRCGTKTNFIFPPISSSLGNLVDSCDTQLVKNVLNE